LRFARDNFQTFTAWRIAKPSPDVSPRYEEAFELFTSSLPRQQYCPDDDRLKSVVCNSRYFADVILQFDAYFRHRMTNAT